MDNEFYLIQYREEIKKGNIVAGQDLIMELDNLIEDLNNPRYYYDPTEAYRRFDFMENCIRLTKSPFYNNLKTIIYDFFVSIVLLFTNN